MKKGIHPKINEIEVTLTDGNVVKVMSTYSKSKEMKLDIDPNTHPAWTGKRNLDASSGQADKFKKRFGGFTG